jgi:NAD(P)H-dependent FMN reductase
MLVIASPVYGLSFPAPLKAIFDRLQRYFEEKFTLGNPAPISRRKPALFLAACGSNDTRGFAIMTEQLDLSLRLMNASLVHSVTVANTDTTPPSPDYLQKELCAAVSALTNSGY